MKRSGLVRRVVTRTEGSPSDQIGVPGTWMLRTAQASARWTRRPWSPAVVVRERDP